jgi:hypothetical protein
VQSQISTVTVIYVFDIYVRVANFMDSFVSLLLLTYSMKFIFHLSFGSCFSC